MRVVVAGAGFAGLMAAYRVVAVPMAVLRGLPAVQSVPDRFWTWNDDPWAGESYSASAVTAAEVLAHARF